jgi:hypothetical protein
MPERSRIAADPIEPAQSTTRSASSTLPSASCTQHSAFAKQESIDEAVGPDRQIPHCASGLTWDRRVEIRVSPAQFSGHGPTPELLRSL